MTPTEHLDSVEQLVADIARVYNKDTPKWGSIESLVETLGWGNIVNTTALGYFRNGGVGDLYIFELLEAATRVNYGQVSIPHRHWVE